MLRKYGILWVVLPLILIADQATKYIIDSTMTLHSSFPVIPGLFNITYIRNPGAAFGFLADASPLFRGVFFILVTILAVGLIVYYLQTQPVHSPLMTTSLSLILSGALGNLIDRIRFGEVIDFLDFYIGNAHWPAFNVADSAISVGAVLLFFTMVKGEKKPSGGP
ncbi:MAG: signal peptidase II [Syntrophales bacterium]|nr:signal peptidase II [Syntrophales bacterium]